ncbi:MAG TPA: ammonia-dependent NAD(+) synthetase [Candidatus Atopostipes pullistercoris]|uniref:NH(3)-dependent NAD(+) synthetase n=1 Tax=Candidatus Atopostipes pullistercoris TaxID=2838467 RepID=A0A9D2G347_9LACT|nr:ammonia-dependent NAD(+) synthetase [Candidatus Atopostipes pullistercoris]
MTTLQEKIIKEMGTQPQIDAQEEIRRSIDFIKDYLKQFPFLKTLVLGISGGQDSTLLGKLAQIAIEEIRSDTGDEAYQFIAVRLPYGVQGDEKDAIEVIKWIQPDQQMVVNIKDSVDSVVDELEKQGQIVSDFNKGNIKARQRMIVQYAIAGDRQGVVLGSDHAAESITGFYTKFGDGAADIMPLFRLNKRQGAKLLQELGAPAAFYTKIPTADLQDNRPALADEEELGVSYEYIDDYLEGKEVPVQAKKRIEQLYLTSQHKRHLPINIFDDFWKI